MSRIYMVAHPDGNGWYYLVPDNYGYHSWLADDTAMTSHPGNGRWKLSTHRADRAVVGVKSGTVNVLSYALKDPATLSERFPAELSPADWDALSESEREIRWPLYGRVTEDIPGERIEHPAEKVIDLGTGEPVPTDGLSWHAELPYELAHHGEVRHLFPGFLDGFRAALCARLRSLGYDAYDHSTFSVSTRVKYSPKREKWTGALLRSGGRSKTKGAVLEEWATRRVEISPARRIAGNTRAEAVAEWSLQLERWVRAVQEWAEPRECGHCNGTGLVQTTITREAS